MTGFVYIMASKRNGTLYTGVTSDLLRRVGQHRTSPEGFVAQYRVQHLVWYEEHADIETAIQRESSLKKWKRVWKLELIEQFNPDWRDLWEEIAS
jgi:putative endonuclease